MSSISINREQLTHLFQLLDDESKEIQQIIRKQILSNSLEIVLNKQFFIETLFPRHRQFFEEILSELHQPITFRAFEQLLEEPQDEISLEKGWLILSFWHSPKIYSTTLRNILDEVAEHVAEKMPHRGHPLTFIDHVNHILFEHYQFRGNSADFYNPLNSFLHCVLETKLGTPISLSALYMLVCQRLQFPVFGVCMPAHFIVKFDNGEDEIFFDPFYKGKVYSRQSCINYLQQFNNYDSEKILQGCSNIEIIKRILRNLHISYSSHTLEPTRLNDIEHLLALIEVYYPDKQL
ncbi:MAG: hypothetical protein D6748_05850 [Calditrichaeota bacterium]|nr:MAG: hypothetical protein D6748_05850 [Calditrichota bacterium]